MLSFRIGPGGLEEDLNFPDQVIVYDDTSAQTGLTGSMSPMIWALKSPPVTLATMQAYRTNYLAQQGAANAFLWTNPLDGVQYTVYFVPKTFKSVLNSDLWTYTVSFKLMRSITGATSPVVSY